jgi:acyl carrier protein
MEDTLVSVPEIVQRIKQILVEDLQLNVVPAEIPDDYSLLEGGLALDSIVIAELIVQIENRFGLQFDDRELEQDLFDNLTRLATYVARECAATSGMKASQAGGASC